MMQLQLTKVSSNDIKAETFLSLFEDILKKIGISEELTSYITVFIFSVLVLIIAKLAHIITTKYFVRYVEHFMKKSKSKYDDCFVKRKLIRRAAYIIPAIIIYSSLDIIFGKFDNLNNILHSLVAIYFIFIVIILSDSFLKSIGDVYDTLPNSTERPIKGYLQGFQLTIILIGILIAISIILNIKLTTVFTGLGAGSTHLIF